MGSGCPGYELKSSSIVYLPVYFSSNTTTFNIIGIIRHLVIMVNRDDENNVHR